MFLGVCLQHDLSTGCVSFLIPNQGSKCRRTRQWELSSAWTWKTIILNNNSTDILLPKLHIPRILHRAEEDLEMFREEMGFAEEEIVTSRSLLLDSALYSLVPDYEALQDQVHVPSVAACRSMQHMPSHLQKHNITCCLVGMANMHGAVFLSIKEIRM